MKQFLYPLRFAPVFKEYIWGGSRMKTVLGKRHPMKTCAESWELSCLPGCISVVCNGIFEGNDLRKLIETYKGELTGNRVYERFGADFPILVKFIDAQEPLSVQVHPDDLLAAERHHSKGKTEMWYVMEAGAESSLIAGFRQKMNRETLLRAIREKRLQDVMNVEKVTPGDVFFIPAGRIHAIGKNILLAEIQQTSDLTYRLYDWERVDANGKPRETHLELALDAIDYQMYDNYRTHYQKPVQGTAALVQCPCFTTNIVCLDQPMTKNYGTLDSFVIYICTAGAAFISWGDAESLSICKGETLLIPASLNEIGIEPIQSTELLEVYL